MQNYSALIFVALSVLAWLGVVSGYRPKQWKVRLLPGQSEARPGDVLYVPLGQEQNGRAMKVLRLTKDGAAMAVDLQDEKYHHGMMALVAVAWPIGLPILFLASALRYISRDGRLAISPKGGRLVGRMYVCPDHRAAFLR